MQSLLYKTLYSHIISNITSNKAFFQNIIAGWYINDMCGCCHKTVQLETAQEKNSPSVYLVAIKAVLLFSGRQTETRRELLVQKRTTIRCGECTTNSPRSKREGHRAQRHHQQGFNKEENYVDAFRKACCRCQAWH